MKIHWTKINQIIQETPDTKTFLLDCPEDFTWEEGAHTHFALEGFNAGEKPNKAWVRHMSISTLPYENKIGITTRIRENPSEFKNILNGLEIGSPIALFKTGTNVPLKRMNKPIYLLSSGVGIATFRPLVLEYLENSEGVHSMHSLNVDSSKNYLFDDLFKTSSEQNFTTQYVDNRPSYYDELQKLTQNKESLFYVVGSDEFLKENIRLLLDHNISSDQITIDKHEKNQVKFFEPTLNA